MISASSCRSESRSKRHLIVLGAELMFIALFGACAFGASADLNVFALRYGNPVHVYVVVENDLGVFTPTTLSKVHAVADQLQGVADVISVDTPLSVQVICATSTTVSVAPAASRGDVPITAAEMTMLSHSILSSPFYCGIVAAETGTACVISLTVAHDASYAFIAARAEEIVEPFRGDGDSFLVYSDLGSDTDPEAATADNILDRSFAGSARLLVEIDTGVRDGLKSPETLAGIVQLEELLYDMDVRRVISLATLIREMNVAFNRRNPAEYVVPASERMIAQLLLLYTFQGGSLGFLAAPDYSSGTLVGYFAPTSEDPLDLLAQGRELSVAVQSFSTTVFDGGVVVSIPGVLHATPVKSARRSGSDLCS